MKKIIQTINPKNQSVINEYPIMSLSETHQILRRAQEAFLHWRSTSFSHRLNALKQLSNTLRNKKENWANLIELEMGKLNNEAISEVLKCADCADYYIENAESFLQDLSIPTQAKNSYVHFSPIGTVFAIMPWNFPFWQVFRCAIPAILAGNTVVLKHASNVTGCALAIEEIFRASFSDGVFSTLIIPGDHALELIHAQEISAVSFTGSTVVGKKIAATAGEALKKAVLELGGSDPYIILDDANLDTAAKACAYSRLINAGQSCISAKRFIVTKKNSSAFIEKLIREMQSATIAPLARLDLKQEVHKQVQNSIELGAKLLLGEEKCNLNSCYYPPTILSNVQTSMPAYKEEIFGPVASIIQADDTMDAIKIANETSFGLGAAIFSDDLPSAEKIARQQLDAGSVFINNFVRSDPRLPFGGIKESGYGRELSSFGIREFTNVKTIWVDSKR